MPSSLQFLNESSECRLYIRVARLHQNDGDVDLAAESLSTARKHLESARLAINDSMQSEESLVLRELEHHLADLESWTARAGTPVETDLQHSTPTPQSGVRSASAASRVRTETLQLGPRKRFGGSPGVRIGFFW